MAKKGSQPRVGKLKSSSGGKSQPKVTVGSHARRIASQPKVGGKGRRR